MDGLVCPHRHSAPNSKLTLLVVSPFRFFRRRYAPVRHGWNFYFAHGVQGSLAIVEEENRGG